LLVVSRCLAKHDFLEPSVVDGLVEDVLMEVGWELVLWNRPVTMWTDGTCSGRGGGGSTAGSCAHVLRLNGILIIVSGFGSVLGFFF